METPVTVEAVMSEEQTVPTRAISNTWVYWVAGLTTTVFATQNVQMGSQENIALLIMTLLFMWGFVRQ